MYTNQLILHTIYLGFEFINIKCLIFIPKYKFLDFEILDSNLGFYKIIYDSYSISSRNSTLKVV